MIAAPTSDGSSARTRAKARDRIVRAVVGPRDQAEHVVGLRRDRAARPSPLRAPCAPPRARRRRTARCRDSAARAPAPDRSRARRGTTATAAGKSVLLEARDADVVGAVGALARGSLPAATGCELEVRGQQVRDRAQPQAQRPRARHVAITVSSWHARRVPNGARARCLCLPRSRASGPRRRPASVSVRARPAT